MLTKSVIAKSLTSERSYPRSENGWAQAIIEREIEDSYSNIRRSIWRQINCRLSYLVTITVQEAENPSDEIAFAYKNASERIFEEVYGEVIARLNMILSTIQHTTREETEAHLKELRKDILGEETRPGK